VAAGDAGESGGGGGSWQSESQRSHCRCGNHRVCQWGHETPAPAGEVNSEH
jgi:hypothetical protein